MTRGYGNVNDPDRQRCKKCRRTMPETKFEHCFSCSHPRHDGETTDAYRKRVWRRLNKEQ